MTPRLIFLIVVILIYGGLNLRFRSERGLLFILFIATVVLYMVFLDFYDNAWSDTGCYRNSCEMSETAAQRWLVYAFVFGLIAGAWGLTALSGGKRKRMRTKYYALRNYRLIHEYPGLEIVPGLEEGERYLSYVVNGQKHVLFCKTLSQSNFYYRRAQEKGLSIRGGTLYEADSPLRMDDELRFPDA